MPHKRLTVADPGFAVGGRRPAGGANPTRALFGGNVCENERIGSRWSGDGADTGGVPPEPPK